LRSCRRLWWESARPPKVGTRTDSQDRMDHARSCSEQLTETLTGQHRVRPADDKSAARARRLRMDALRRGTGAHPVTRVRTTGCRALKRCTGGVVPAHLALSSARARRADQFSMVVPKPKATAFRYASSAIAVARTPVPERS